MPIFNAEAYLENSLNSVINQTMGFENIELILVDDCSTDNSRTILEHYGKKYSNIKTIFLEENTGCPGIPRNIGIKTATSDYIMFIDNDDEYFYEMCDKLYNTIISEDADIIVSNVLFTDGDGDRNGFFGHDKFVRGGEIIYFDNILVWNCIFKKSLILDNKISFIDGIYEDAFFIMEYYLYSKKLVYLDDFIGYHHFERQNSLSMISFDHEIKNINAFYGLVKLLDGVNCDLNRIFKTKIEFHIWRVILLGNKDEMRVILNELSNFEKSIDFTGNLLIIYKFINFFILHNHLNIATYICLFISKIRSSKLFLKIYRKFFQCRQVDF